jgi:hypothetical protein
MAKPTDRVQIAKQERAATGGNPADDDDMLYATLNPVEDAPDMAGIYFQEDVGSGVSSADTQVAIFRDDDDLQFCDVANSTPVTLSDLLQGNLPPATQVGQVLYSVDGLTFTVQQPLTSKQGWLVNNDGELLVCG